MSYYRPSFEETAMNIALQWADRSTCSTRAQVGAVLVTTDNRVIASGYNGSPKGLPHCDDVGCELDSDGHCISAIHAEENVILQCATTGVSCAGSVMYITRSPCTRCARRIIQARIRMVVYLLPYGDPEPVVKLLRSAGIPMVRMSQEEP